MPYHKDEIQSVKGLGGIFSIGDKVSHEGSEEKEKTATIEGFYWDTEKGEIRANTTEGHACLDYLSKEG